MGGQQSEDNTSLMLVTTGPEVDHFYLRLVVQFYQNVLLKSTAHSSQLQPVVTGIALTQRPDGAFTA